MKIPTKFYVASVTEQQKVIQALLKMAIDTLLNGDKPVKPKLLDRVVNVKVVIGKMA